MSIILLLLPNFCKFHMVYNIGGKQSTITLNFKLLCKCSGKKKTIRNETRKNNNTNIFKGEDRL